MFEIATAFLMPYWLSSNGKYVSVEKKKGGFIIKGEAKGFVN